MTRDEIIRTIARAIAEVEGYHLTPRQAAARRVPWPSIAQRLANPGCIRRWRSAGRPYPQTDGYVDLVRWAAGTHRDCDYVEVLRLAHDEGWRILFVLVGHYIDGRYHHGRSPTLAQMISTYAPATDRNEPTAYARAIAKLTGLPLDRPLSTLIEV